VTYINTKALVKFRERAGYCQEKMATLLGYKSKGSYCLIEQGKTKVSIELALKIKYVLKLSTNEFLEFFYIH